MQFFVLNHDHAPMNLFHRTAAFLLILFMGIMAIATGIAFTRKSGNTGMDMGKVHLLRQKVAQK